jgi:hypothetical protein
MIDQARILRCLSRAITGKRNDLTVFDGAIKSCATSGRDPVNATRPSSALCRPPAELRLFLWRDVGDGVAFPELLPVRQIQPLCLRAREVLCVVVPGVQQNGIDQDFVWCPAVLAFVRDDPLRELERCGLKV